MCGYVQVWLHAIHWQACPINWNDVNWPPKSIRHNLSWNSFQKTQSHGLLWRMHCMVSVYLSKNIFFVSIENQLSDYRRILRGVPQGLILEPIHFLSYVNDMPQPVTQICFYMLTIHVLYSNIKTLKKLKRY